MAEDRKINGETEPTDENEINHTNDIPAENDVTEEETAEGVSVENTESAEQAEPVKEEKPSQAKYRTFHYVRKEDYDKTVTVNGDDLAVYSKDKLKELYPNEDYPVLGETYESKKRDKEKDIGRIELNERPLYVVKPGEHSKIFKKQDSFVEVKDGGFLVLLKTRLLPFILLGILLLGLIVGGIAIAVSNRNEPVNPAPVAPDTNQEDPYIEPIVADILNISGKVTEDGQTVAGATLELKSGTKVVDTATVKSDGTYLLADVQRGVYNLECTCGDSVQSKIALIDGESIVLDFAFRADSDVKAIVEYKNDDGEALSIAVDGLSDEAYQYAEDFKEVDVTLFVEKKDTESLEAEFKTEKDAIEEMANELRNLSYFDFSVLKEVFRNAELESSQKLTKTKTVLQIIVPHDSSKAIGTYVFRYHGEEAQRFEELDTLPEATAYKDGTYYVTKDYVYVYTDSFSIYAIGSMNIDKTIKGEDTFSFSDEIRVNLTTGEITMSYAHDADSTHNVRIDLYLGNVLIAQSGIIPPGSKLTKMILASDAKDTVSQYSGTYKGTMRIVYVGDTSDQASTQVDIPATVIITAK